jgi:bile acid:Na+ symporter, BASS family
MSDDSSSSPPASESTSNKVDQILASLTSAFPFFVLGSAILALIKPSTLLWTNQGDLITIMLASVMWGTGLTLTKDDFTVVLQKDLAAVPAGVLCQFLIMPLSAFLLGRTLLLPSKPYGSALFLGLCLVGCSPGGTASNLVSLIAKADVALSVLLTSCSTILASVVTPLLVKLLVGSTIAVSGWTLCTATARVVLLPVVLGMIVNARAPTLASTVSRFTPFCSVVLVALICGGVVAENARLLLSTSAGLLPLIVSSVLGLHCLGFLVGYLVPKLGLGFGEKTSRTISIETGMQNSALAVVLARSIGAPAIASLPGALSATAHSCLGSILAAYWRGVDSNSSISGNTNKAGDSTLPTESPDDYPELLI